MNFDPLAIDLTDTPWRRVMLSERQRVWCLVDAEHYDWLVQWNWNVAWGSATPWKYYAKRNILPSRTTLRMHRELMIRLTPGANLDLLVDHVNGCSLDNRVENLRWVTPQGNRANQMPRDRVPCIERVLEQLLERQATEAAHFSPAEPPF